MNLDVANAMAGIKRLREENQTFHINEILGDIVDQITIDESIDIRLKENQQVSLSKLNKLKRALKAKNIEVTTAYTYTSIERHGEETMFEPTYLYVELK